MSLKIGIVGLPNVGKSTLFRALTKQSVDIANYPFATINPNVGIVPVPDERLEKLAAMSHSLKTIPASVEFVDIAGLVKGAAEGGGLGNKFLTHIREVDAIAEVVRVFKDSEIIHVAGKADPLNDIEVLEYELILKDLETVNKRLEAVEREVKGQKKGAAEEFEDLRKAAEGLKTGHFIYSNVLKNIGIVRDLQLLTAKPIIYVFNASEKQIQSRREVGTPTSLSEEDENEASGEKWQPEQTLKEKIGSSPWVVISARVEAELADLSEKERKEYLRALGVTESGLDQLIRKGYETLNLITFFTTGEDETRAWTIPKNSRAPRAGRAIHSDFEEKFIRAEVINWQKLLETGSWAKARELGWLSTEGKEYIVRDGDVIEFKI